MKGKTIPKGKEGIPKGKKPSSEDETNPYKQGTKSFIVSPMILRDKMSLPKDSLEDEVRDITRDAGIKEKTMNDILCVLRGKVLSSLSRHPFP